MCGGCYVEFKQENMYNQNSMETLYLIYLQPATFKKIEVLWKILKQ